MTTQRVRGAARSVRRLVRPAVVLVRSERTQYAGALHPSMWRRGFLSNRRYAYPDVHDRAVPYVSDLAVETRMLRINTLSARALLDDKNVFADALTARGLAPWAPDVYGTILAGRFRPRSPEAAVRMRSQEAVVVKPLNASGGRGVHLVAGAVVESAREPADTDWLVQERLLQHPVLSAINPTSLNTIRALAVRIPGRGPVLAAAVQRWGTAATGIVDNVSSGGLCSRVDLETGECSEAVARPAERRRVAHDEHPDSGSRITGVAIPHWAEAKDLVLRLMHAFPEVDHVGWDLCITDDGPRVVEGNAGVPNPNVFQFHGHFLHDPDVRRYYVDRGLLGSRFA